MRCGRSRGGTWAGALNGQRRLRTWRAGHFRSAWAALDGWKRRLRRSQVATLNSRETDVTAHSHGGTMVREWVRQIVADPLMIVKRQG